MTKIKSKNSGKTSKSKSTAKKATAGKSASAAKKRSTAKTAKQAAANKPKVVSEEDIRRRAHEIYLERGGHGGSEEEDWIQAERELRSEI